MCDPITATVIGVVGSMASAMISYSQQQDLMSKQEDANAQWVAYQRRKSQEEWQRQEEQRQRADAAREDTLNKLKPDEQKQAQSDEQQRVQQDITPEMADQSPQTMQDALLSGQKGGSPIIKAEIADRITQASKDARQRIANLATIQSYGTSQFGLQNRAQDLFNQSSQNIDLANNMRRGSLAAYGVEKGVEPIKYAASPSPFGGIAGSLAGIAGKGFGGIGGGGVSASGFGP